MRLRVLAAMAATALVANPAAAADEVKIGFINTFSGGLAVFGKHQRDGLELALDHLDRKIGGLDVEMVYGDDQAKPDVGRQAADRMLKSDRVDFVTGITWSNVLAAVQSLVTRRKVFMISTNAGWSEMAGKGCDPYFFTTSWNNDQHPEALGKLMQDERIEDVFMIAPNYQAGKDMIAGFQRYYKGTVKGQILTRLGQQDYAAEIAQMRSAEPKAIFAFLPGPMGIAFLKQWRGAGLAERIGVYTVFTVDYLTLGGVGESAIGTFHTSYWSPDLPFEQNKKFVADFQEKYDYMPSQYSAQAYDLPLWLDSAVRAVDGDLDDKEGLGKALEKVDYPSTRGPYTLNTNHMPIQNFYKREVVKGPDGKPMIVSRGAVFENHKDSYYEQCKMKTWN